MTVSKLLKSCAIPPASVPMDSIFCACRNCCSSFRRSVRSRMAAHPHKPSSVSSMLNLISTGNSLPSRRNPQISKVVPLGDFCGPLRNMVRYSKHFSRSLSGTKMSIGCPNKSSRRYPNVSSACAFTSTIRPSRFTTTTGSAADSSKPRNLASAARKDSAERFCWESSSLCARWLSSNRTLEQPNDASTATTASFNCWPIADVAIASTTSGKAICANCASSKDSDELSLSAGSGSLGATQLVANQIISILGIVHSSSYQVPNCRPCHVWAYTKTESQIPNSTRKIAIRPKSDFTSRDFVSTALNTNVNARMKLRQVNIHQ